MGISFQLCKWNCAGKSTKRKINPTISNHARNKNKNIKCSAHAVRQLRYQSFILISFLHRNTAFTVLSKDQHCITMNVNLMKQKN